MYRDKAQWTKMSIMSTAGSGFFSSDRTIADVSPGLGRKCAASRDGVAVCFEIHPRTSADVTFCPLCAAVQQGHLGLGALPRAGDGRMSSLEGRKRAPG